MREGLLCRKSLQNLVDSGGYPLCPECGDTLELLLSEQRKHGVSALVATAKALGYHGGTRIAVGTVEEIQTIIGRKSPHNTLWEVRELLPEKPTKYA